MTGITGSLVGLCPAGLHESRDALDALSLGLLSPEETLRVHTHIKICDRCWAVIENLVFAECLLMDGTKFEGE